MSLAKRQAAVINQIIQEEVQKAISARNERPRALHRGQVQESLMEAGPDAMRVDLTIMNDQVGDAAEDLGIDMSQELVSRFQQKIVRFIATEMSKHGMSAVGINPRTFNDELEEFDQDGMMELQMECNSDILAALAKFAQGVGQLAVHMAGGREADEEEFEG